MTKYLAGVLTVIAVGVLGVAYGLLVPRATGFESAGTMSLMRSDPMSMAQPLTTYVMPQAAPRVVAYVPATQYATGPAPQYAAMPAAPYGQPMVVAAAPSLRPVQTVSYEPSAPRRVVRERYVERTPRRDWKKTAMIIGGSSAAGAGIGAIFGGKKGALIGAAIGGGASTIYETRK